MTVPYLTNCDHDPNGWCSVCVKTLWEEKEEWRKAGIDFQVKIDRLCDEFIYKKFELQPMKTWEKELTEEQKKEAVKQLIEDGKRNRIEILRKEIEEMGIEKYSSYIIEKKEKDIKKNNHEKGSQEHFLEHLERVSKIVEKWPVWKQELLGKFLNKKIKENIV